MKTKEKRLKTTLGKAIFFHISYKDKFKLGRTIYEYIGRITDMRMEEVTYVTSGKKSIEQVEFNVYVVKDEKGNYKALSDKEYGDRIVEIL